MLPLDDARWQFFEGGYRIEYDASAALRRLFAEGSSAALWDELFEELHHQGDLGQASYASVPWIVEFIRRAPKIEWQPLALVALIDLERTEHRNPVVCEAVYEGYFAAIRALPRILGIHADEAWDEFVFRYAVACIALARGQRWYARVYFELDRDTASRWFSEEFGREIDPD